ncbi:MAG: peptidyl-tRNA hydrolase Pth2 [Candidatus Altiarchaeota archaeon]
MQHHQYILVEFKQVIVVRSDLAMGKGKIAAQASHAAVATADKSRYKADWLSQGQKKTVVKVTGEKELLTILHAARDAGLPTVLIEDAGHTQVEPGTKTCVGIGPAPVEQIDKITGKLKLL